MTYPIITQKEFTVKELAARIDHSLLMPFTSEDEIRKFIQEIKTYGFKIACVNNSNTELAVKLLEGTDAKVATVVAFPFGALSPENKAKEVQNAIDIGAGTVDMVVNLGAIKSGNWDKVYKDLAMCSEVAHKNGVTIKAIIECCYLTYEEKIKICETALKADMDYVKTATGFAVNGYFSTSWVGDVKLMKSVVGEKMGVKASGPIPDYDTAVTMLNAGAERLGSRAGVQVLRGCTDWEDYSNL